MKQAKAPNPLERLMGALQNSGVYPHPVGRIEVFFNLPPEAKSGSGIGVGPYSQNADDMTYARLAEIAETGMRAGYPVIVDATFLKCAQRVMCRELAHRLQAPFAILDFKADEVTLRERIARREQQGPNAWEANLTVLDHQLANQQPLAQEELPHVIAVDDASGG